MIREGEAGRSWYRDVTGPAEGRTAPDAEFSGCGCRRERVIHSHRSARLVVAIDIEPDDKHVGGQETGAVRECHAKGERTCVITRDRDGNDVRCDSHIA
jgi:hypothetical protein